MKVLLLNSGGPDSLAVAELLKDRYEIDSLFIRTLSPNAEKAEVTAKGIAEYYSHNFYTLDLEIGIHETEVNSLPFQGMVVWTVGMSWAIDRGYQALAVGLKNNEAMEEDFLIKFKELMGTSRYTKPLKIITPLLGFEKYNEVYKIIKNVDVKTTSCQMKEECGTCFKCIERKRLAIK